MRPTPTALTALLALLSLVVAVPAAAQGVPMDPEPAEEPTETPPPTPLPAPPPAPRPPAAPVVGQARIAIGPLRVSGPRTGVTILSARTVERINDAFQTFDAEGRDDVISASFPVITQFGWQFETRMFQTEQGLTGLAEWVLLVGGVERGVALPSLSFLAGLRAPSGFEVGVGPNISVGGAAYAVAVGATQQFGEIGIPVNLAVVFGQDGPRVSALVGFTVSDRRW